jgi:myo-inositol 2-dehydrogenase / D-chiro-inositol 1-dehydrogenase
MARFTRRQALAGTAASAAANLMIVSPETAFGSQANSAVAFGIIGTGGRGRYVGSHMSRDSQARLAAICDIYPDRIDSAKTEIPGGDKARVYRDYKEMLASPDIDAVLIATPVFLHPVHFEAAVGANKHIYCEKPAGADVAGVKRLVAASDRADKRKTIQFGFQQRFSPEYLTAYDILKSGRIGNVSLVTSFWVYGGNPPAPPSTPMAQLAPEDEKIRRWGAWMATSGGYIVEQDCHGVDMLNWFAGAHPLKAYGTGNLRYPIYYGDQDTDHHQITYSYPGKVEGWLHSIKHTVNFRDVREQVFASKGALETGRTFYKWHGPIKTSAAPHADDLRDRSVIESRNSKREITIDAVEAFFKSIVEGKPYNMAPVAAEATFTSLLGRMAYQTHREVTWEEMLRSA